MIKFNECELKIIFKYSKCNEKFMEVRVGDTLLDPQDGYATYTGLLELPAQVTITTSGKNHRYDTKVDESGNICEDLAVQIESIKLDSFDLNEKYIHQKINLNFLQLDLPDLQYIQLHCKYKFYSCILILFKSR